MMGADLIGWMFTAHKDRLPDVERASSLIRSADAKRLIGLFDDDTLEMLDVPSYDDGETPDEEDLASLRASLASGARVLAEELNTPDSTIMWEKPGSPYLVCFTGGSTWGDQPFDGYDDFSRIMEAIASWPELASALAVVCLGPPGPNEFQHPLFRTNIKNGGAT